MDLKNCPFCGGEAEFNQQGNDYTRTRKSIIKCSQCKVRMVVGAIHRSLDWTAGVVSENWNTRAPVSVTDEALRIATGKHWRYFNQSSGDAEYFPDAMEKALEAAIPHLAPVSVTNDPRVVAIIEAARRVEENSIPQSRTTSSTFTSHISSLRAALANLEKKESSACECGDPDCLKGAQTFSGG